MRYHYEKPRFNKPTYGQLYICDHPVYSRCTLFLIRDKGLAVIQQRLKEDKSTYWTEIDGWLTGELYLHPRFLEYFNKYAAEQKNGLYPTVTLRQIMWGLKMKPLARECWETYFDRKTV